jgi:AbrB family looped-hinge helix DNA binding protein
MPAFEATLTSKGQITIPAELRAKLGLKEGDKLEFYIDRSGTVLVRPRNASPSAVFDNPPKRGRRQGGMTDDEAIVASVLEKDRRGRRRRRAA